MSDSYKVEKDMIVKEYLTNVLKLSYAEIKRLKFHGDIKVNGQHVTVNKKLEPGDEICLEHPEIVNEKIQPEHIDLDIVYEDEYLLVVIKPIGMAVHPSGRTSTGTLAGALVGKYGNTFVTRFINRLDKYTAGPVIVAKTSDSSKRLYKQFIDRKVSKKYEALVEGITDESGVIELPIERETEGIVKRCVTPNGKYAKTEYRALKYFENSTLIEAIPITGRTHQIRVHMAAIGHPLKYDFLYGKEVEGKRFLLTCTYLAFEHPYSGEVIEINNPSNITD